MSKEINETYVKDGSQIFISIKIIKTKKKKYNII